MDQVDQSPYRRETRKYFGQLDPFLAYLFYNFHHTHVGLVSVLLFGDVERKCNFWLIFSKKNMMSLFRSDLLVFPICCICPMIC
jgi:hypothetical protein